MQDLIYMAGFFDGEGCIRINKRKRPVNPEYTIFISLGQKDGETMDWIVSTFGGTLHKVARDGSYMWIITNKKAVDFLQKITPYLRYKKPQALKALELAQNYRVTRQVTKEEIARREALYLEVKRLKNIFSPATMFAGSTTKRTDPKGM